jgi:uncharacterized protein
MSIDVGQCLAHPGRRAPIHTVLSGSTADEADLRTLGKIAVDGQAFAQLGVLYLDVDLRGEIDQPCRRCLKPIHRTFVLHEAFEVPIAPGAEKVEIRPLAASLLLSADDPNVLCRPDCRGLCPVCGIDLNEHPDHVCSEAAEDRHSLRDYLIR